MEWKQQLNDGNQQNQSNIGVKSDLLVATSKMGGKLR
jgi:hypothetical protein